MQAQRERPLTTLTAPLPRWVFGTLACLALLALAVPCAARLPVVALVVHAAPLAAADAGAVLDVPDPDPAGGVQANRPLTKAKRSAGTLRPSSIPSASAVGRTASGATAPRRRDQDKRTQTPTRLAPNGHDRSGIAQPASSRAQLSSRSPIRGKPPARKAPAAARANKVRPGPRKLAKR